MDNIIYAEFVTELANADRDQIETLVDMLAEDNAFVMEAGEEFVTAVGNVERLFQAMPEMADHRHDERLAA